MRDKGDMSETTPSPPNRSTVVLLLGTIADTTWRMFVPTISMILLGNWADDQLNTTPWLMLVGVIIGSIIAGLLIRQQLSQKV